MCVFILARQCYSGSYFNIVYHKYDLEHKKDFCIQLHFFQI